LNIIQNNIKEGSEEMFVIQFLQGDDKNGGSEKVAVIRSDGISFSEVFDGLIEDFLLEVSVDIFIEKLDFVKEGDRGIWVSDFVDILAQKFEQIEKFLLHVTRSVGRKVKEMLHKGFFFKRAGVCVIVGACCRVLVMAVSVVTVTVAVAVILAEKIMGSGIVEGFVE